jgi:predicted DNA-binding transcriptional regulator AlpA
MQRRAVADMLAISLATLKRRESSDPDFPQRLALGGRWAYRAADIAAYQSVLAARAAATTATQSRTAAAQRAAVARRARASIAAPDAPA